MLESSRLLAVAEMIRDQISPAGIDSYCQETGIGHDDFQIIEPQDNECEIFAVDGSNVVVCDWSVASLNLIRAGYAVYNGRDWKRTVFTYDDLFLADQESYADWFEPYLRRFFAIDRITFKESDLERLSTYFRELQEYIALQEAIREARPGDLILYDGGFDIFEPLRTVLRKVLAEAKRKGVALLGVSKSSAISWGEGQSRPVLQHTAYAGDLFAPGLPWYVSLSGKRVRPAPNWDGKTMISRFDSHSGRAFRVDVPSYLANGVGGVLGRISGHSCSAECLGYPHALFRAHRDIKITSQEGDLLLQELKDLLGEMGVNDHQFKILMQDFHEILDMKP